MKRLDAHNRYSRRGFLKAGAGAVAAGAIAATLRPRSSYASAPEDASREFSAVVASVREMMAMAHVPGVALAIYGNGREEVATLGLADVERGLPVTEATRFQNGSVTKPYTALAARRLADAGKRNIHAPVRNYVPDLRLADGRTADHVTVRHLLTHTGGWWGDAFVDTGNGDDAIARFVSETMPRLPQITPLGDHMSYNNAGFVLLARVIELITGQTYRTAMQDLVFGPMGLDRTTFDPNVVFSGPYSQGYGPEGADRAAKITPLLLPRSVDPAGGIWTNIRDQMRFARFQLYDEAVPRILNRASLRDMHSPLKEIDGGAIGWTWGLFDVAGMGMISHDGKTFGQSSSLVAVPEQGFAGAVLTNSQRGEAVTRAASMEAIKQYFGFDPSESETAEDGGAPSEIEMPPAELRQYAGRYELPTDRLTLSVEDGRLHLKHDSLDFPGIVRPSNEAKLPAGTLHFLAADVVMLRRTDGRTTQIAFVRKADGTIGWASVSERMLPKLG